MRHQNIVELKNNGMNNIESNTGEIITDTKRTYCVKF